MDVNFEKNKLKFQPSKSLFFKFFNFWLLLLSFLFIIISLTANYKKNLSYKSKASEQKSNLKSILPTQEFETKIVSLEENANKDLSISLKNNLLKITFPQQTLNPDLALNNELEAKILPHGNDQTKIIVFSLNLKSKEKEPPKKMKKELSSYKETGDRGGKNTSLESPSTEKKEEDSLFSSKSIKERKDFYLLEYQISQLEEQYILSSLKFIYLNPQTGKWEEIPTEIDKKNSKISAKVNHFSNFGVAGQKAQVFSPTLKNWESSLYTGAVTYSYNIETVPGIGGLSPNLALTYNSNRANSLSSQQKGSWVGPGWDLTLPEIRFDGWTEKEGTNQDCQNFKGTRKRGPQYSLVLWGVDEPLYWIDDLKNGNQFVASKFISKTGILVFGYYGQYQGKERFDSPSCNDNSGRKLIITRWVAYGKDGKEYVFDANLNNSAADRLIKNTLAPSRYMVTEIKDLSGNRIIFEYEKDIAESHALSVYPKLIKYNFQGSTPYAAVEFFTTQKTYQPDFSTLLSQTPPNLLEMNFERRKLSEIRVYSNYQTKAITKTYKFIYDTEKYKYPYKFINNSWQQTGYDTLVKIDVYQGAEQPKTKFVTETYDYELRTVGFEYLPIHNNDWHSGWYSSCEQPFRLTLTWDQFANKILNPSDYDKPVLCSWEREKLLQRGVHFCRGANPMEINGGFSIPQSPQPGCPTLTQTIGFYSVETCTPRWDDQGFHCDYTVWQGTLIGFETGKAPFIKKINNGYGGEVSFTYRNFLNPKKEYSYNRNVVIAREEKDLNNSFIPPIKNEYSYDPIPTSEEVRPEKGGGFHRVTVKNTATNMLTTTYYYPLAPKIINEEVKDDNTVNDPERNPFWGLPLRTVIHRYEGGQDLIYSDQFTSYSFIPVYQPMFVDNSLTATLISEGVGKAVAVSIDNFTPKKSNFVAIPIVINKPQYFDYHADTLSNNPQFLHTQKKFWYDQYGEVIKTAEYGEVKGFIDYSSKADLSTRREVIGKWFEGENARNYTFGLPMTPLLFNQQGPVVNNPPSAGTPTTDSSLRRFSYSKYLRTEQDNPYIFRKSVNEYLKKNLTALVVESFSSNRDDTFANIPEIDRYQWTINQYDADGKIRGFVSSTITKNTFKPQERLKLKNGNDMPDEITARTEYDQFGNVTKTIDPKGTITETFYYTTGAFAFVLPQKVETEIKDPNGQLITKSSGTTEYDPIFWLPIKTTDPNNLVSKVEYDCLGRLQKVYQPDLASNLINATPEETYIYFDYQSEGCGIGAVNKDRPLPHLRTKKKISYLENDQEKENYLYTDNLSDGFGRPIQSQVLKTKVEGVDKSLVSYVFYNNQGLKEKESSPMEYSPITISNDINPQPSYVPIPPRNEPEFTFYHYDELGRVIKTTDPLGNISRTEFAGLITRSFDANNSQKNPSQNPTYTETEVNGLGQTVKTIIAHVSTPNQNAYGLMTINQYDPILNVPISTSRFRCQSKDCKTNENELLFSSQVSYDRLGRKWKIQDPDLGVWYFAYDQNGNIVRQKDAKDQIIDFSYDSQNRLVKKEYTGKPRANLPTYKNRNSIDYIYDQDLSGRKFIGKLLRMIDLTGETVYEYNYLGRLTKELKIIDKKLFTPQDGKEEVSSSFVYYKSGALKSITFSSNQTFISEINDVGQINKIKTGELKPGQFVFFNTLLHYQKYNRFGLPTEGQIGNFNNNLKTVKEYDQLARLTKAKVSKGTQDLIDYQYSQRDKVGNILRIIKNPENKQFLYNYDSVYQLTRVTGAQEGIYNYDPKGNLLSKQEGRETVVMEYNDPDHIHAPKKVNGFTYQYDKNGNLLEDETRTFTWDYDNKPVLIYYKKTGQTVELAYDGNGNRVIKRNLGGDTTLYFNTFEKTFDKDGKEKGNKVSYSVISATYQITKKADGSKEEVLLYSDHLDSTVLLTDLQGNKLSEALYYPYGADFLQSPSLSNYTNRQFTNQIKDDPTLYYYNARYYNPRTAHFISADKAEGPNRYAYVGNNPIMRNDPSGKVVCVGEQCNRMFPGLKEASEQFPETPTPPTNFGEWLSSGLAHAANLFGFGQFLPENLKQYISKNEAMNAVIINSLPQPAATVYSGANIQRYYQIKDAAENFVRSSRSTNIISRGLNSLEKYGDASRELREFYDYLAEKGVNLVKDTFGKYKSGGLYTTADNLVRTIGDDMIIHPDLWEGLKQGKRWAQEEMLIHGLHDYYAIVAERYITGPRQNAQQGFGTFIHLADYYFSKLHFGAKAQETISRLNRAAKTIFKEFGFEIIQ